MTDRITDEQRALVLEWRSGYAGSEDNPAGAVELSDDDLETVAGAKTALGCVTATLGALSVIFCAPTPGSGSCGAFSYGCCPTEEPCGGGACCCNGDCSC